MNKRTASITLHFTVEEKKLIKEAAALSGLPLKKFLERILPYISSQIKGSTDA
jgi:uncharacterized protein (DUF1778 family)